MGWRWAFWRHERRGRGGQPPGQTAEQLQSSARRAPTRRARAHKPRHMLTSPARRSQAQARAHLSSQALTQGQVGGKSLSQPVWPSVGMHMPQKRQAPSQAPSHLPWQPLTALGLAAARQTAPAPRKPTCGGGQQPARMAQRTAQATTHRSACSAGNHHHQAARSPLPADSPSHLTHHPVGC